MDELRVARARRALRGLGIDTELKRAVLGHAPDCPRGERCWCSRQWVRL